MISILNTLLLLVIAVSFPGVVNRVRALLAGRKGIRFMQHLYDLRLQLRKGAVYAPGTTLLFRAVPPVLLGSSIVALLFVPVGNLTPLFSFDGDVICFASLLALGRFGLILAALDTGSPFEGMGASREALYGALVEPAMMLILATLAMLFGCTSFAGIFAAGGAFDIQFVIVLLLTAYLAVELLFVESGRLPVDDPRTHLELTMIHEVMCLDYCGIDLGMIKLAGWLKTAALAAIAADALCAATGGGWPVAAVVAALLPGVAVGVVESTQARNKLSRNTTFILTIAAVAALVFFVGALLRLNIAVR